MSHPRFLVTILLGYLEGLGIAMNYHYHGYHHYYWWLWPLLVSWSSILLSLSLLFIIAVHTIVVLQRSYNQRQSLVLIWMQQSWYCYNIIIIMNNYSIIIIVGGHSSNDCLLAWQPELLQLSTVMYSGIVHLQYSQ